MNRKIEVIEHDDTGGFVVLTSGTLPKSAAFWEYGIIVEVDSIGQLLDVGPADTKPITAAELCEMHKAAAKLQKELEEKR